MNDTHPLPRLTRSGRLVPQGLDEALLRRVVETFYARARQDPIIGPVFNNAIGESEWPEHLATITDFWSSMLLGLARYQGRPMAKHLQLPVLGDEHFRVWLTLWGETVLELCPPSAAAMLIDRAERIGHNFRIGLRLRRGEETPELEFYRATKD